MALKFWNRKKDEEKKPDLGGLKSVSKVRGDWTLATSEALYSAVGRIANAVAMLPLHLYNNYEIATDDYREKLLSYMPNAYMTPYFFKSTMEAFRNTEGNAYALIVPDPVTNKIQTLDVLDAAQVTPQREKETKEMWYSFTLDNGASCLVHSSRMLVLRHLSANGEKGIRPIDVLRGSLTYTEKIREFSLNQLDSVNGGIVLTLPSQAIDEERKKKLVNSFIDTYKKSGGRVMVLEGGMQATNLSRSPVDANVLDAERITRNRVATVYGIPPHFLGDYSNSSYSNNEQSQQEFLDMTILPIVTQWQEELNLKLLTWEEIRKGFAFRFDLNGMKKADKATTGEYHQKAIRGGWMKINEVRKIDGLPPVAGGEELLASRDLTKLSDVINGTVE